MSEGEYDTKSKAIQRIIEALAWEMDSFTMQQLNRIEAIVNE